MGNSHITTIQFFFYYSDEIELSDQNAFCLSKNSFQNLKYVFFVKCNFESFRAQHICQAKWENLEHLYLSKLNLTKTIAQ